MELGEDGVLSHESAQDTIFTTFIFDFTLRGPLSTTRQANLWSTQQAHGITLMMARRREGRNLAGSRPSRQQTSLLLISPI